MGREFLQRLARDDSLLHAAHLDKMVLRGLRGAWIGTTSFYAEKHDTLKRLMIEIAVWVGTGLTFILWYPLVVMMMWI